MTIEAKGYHSGWYDGALNISQEINIDECKPRTCK